MSKKIGNIMKTSESYNIELLDSSIKNIEIRVVFCDKNGLYYALSSHYPKIEGDHAAYKTGKHVYGKNFEDARDNLIKLFIYHLSGIRPVEWVEYTE